MKIAVIGSGIAGLGAAWLLSRRHKVTVYERNAYAGGHSNTVDVPIEGGDSIPVDTGFIVYNERTYPNLIGLLDTLGVARIKTDMSFAVSADGGPTGIWRQRPAQPVRAETQSRLAPLPSDDPRHPALL